jgi:hypothetical protein
MAETTDHTACEDLLRIRLAAAPGDPIEVTISTAPPLISGPFTEGFRCPHGVTFWMEPTGDQRAQWARDAKRPDLTTTEEES